MYYQHFYYSLCLFLYFNRRYERNKLDNYGKFHKSAYRECTEDWRLLFESNEIKRGTASLFVGEIKWPSWYLSRPSLYYACDTTKSPIIRAWEHTPFSSISKWRLSKDTKISGFQNRTLFYYISFFLAFF